MGEDNRDKELGVLSPYLNNIYRKMTKNET